MTVQAFFTVVFGVAATVIAVQQWYTNKTKLKIDLFEKRWPIYTHTAAFLRATSSGEITGKELNDFIETVCKSEFLYDREMYDYLDRLHREGFKVTRMSPEKITVCSEHHNELSNLKERFSSYLDLK